MDIVTELLTSKTTARLAILYTAAIIHTRFFMTQFRTRLQQDKAVAYSPCHVLIKRKTGSTNPKSSHQSVK